MTPDADLGADKDSVVRRLAGLVAGTGRATGAESERGGLPVCPEDAADLAQSHGTATPVRTAAV